MALKLVTLLALAVSTYAQYGFQNTGFQNQAFRGFQTQGFNTFQRSPFGLPQGFSPVQGFAPQQFSNPSAVGSGDSVRAATIGYDPVLSVYQGRGTYAYNLGYDLSNSVKGYCDRTKGYVNPLSGECVCYGSFSGATCSIEPAELANPREQPQICTQTQSDITTLVGEDANVRTLSADERALYNSKRSLVSLMASPASVNLGGLLKGPGAAPFCKDAFELSSMAPPPVRSALSDYGYIVCSSYKTCYNQACPECTLFNSATKVCEPPTDSERRRRGLPVCNVGNGPANAQVKLQWTQRAIAETQQRLASLRGGINPAINPAGVNPAAPNAAVGNAIGRGGFFG